MYTIQIVGAGYLGSRVARFFIEKKQKVFALTRSNEKARIFSEQGIRPVVADLIQPEMLSLVPPANFIVICPAPDESTETTYEAIYLKGIAHYLKAIQKNPKPHLIVYVSSTGVWQDQTGDLFDETVLPKSQSAKARILLEAEKQILNCGLPAAVLRLSGIYGPGRNRLQAFREGSWPVSKQDRWMNLIHVEDIAEAMPIFFKNAKEGEVYLGTDDEPFLCSSLADWLSQKTGIMPKVSFEVGSLPAGRRLKNTKFKDLGIRLKYPTFREGYQKILEEEKQHGR